MLRNDSVKCLGCLNRATPSPWGNVCIYRAQKERVISKISQSRRQDKLCNRIPTSFTPQEMEIALIYNSISILHFGNKEQTALLRLASVEYAIGHFKHYMAMVE